MRMELEVQIAGADDDPHDPSSVWADECERVIVGTLEVTAIDPDADVNVSMAIAPCLQSKRIQEMCSAA